MLMAHLRRKDDGPLTMVLSWLGWPLLITARVLVFSLIANQIHYWLFLLCSLHVLFFSFWVIKQTASLQLYSINIPIFCFRPLCQVYNIAIESYGISSSSAQTSSAPFDSRRKRVSLAVMVTFFFGIPSIFYWPIMFQLREQRRPLIYLLIIVLENLVLLALWFGFQIKMEPSLTDQQTLLIAAVVAATLGGVFFISLYVFCKPKYTDQVVLYEIRQNMDELYPSLHKISDSSTRPSNANEYGVYYDFCDIVFKLPSTAEIGKKLRHIRSDEGGN
jgi:hypothetical protein